MSDNIIPDLSKILISAGVDSSKAIEKSDIVMAENKRQTKENPDLPEGNPEIMKQIQFVLGKAGEIDTLKESQVQPKKEIDAYDSRMKAIDSSLERLQSEWNERESEDFWGGLETFFTRDADGNLGMKRAWNTLFNTYPEGHELHEKGFKIKGGKESKKQEIFRLKKERLDAQLEFEDSRLLTGQEDFMSPSEMNVGKKSVYSRREGTIAELEDNFEVFQSRLEKVYGERMPDDATGFTMTHSSADSKKPKGEWTYGDK
jgi:hypothetical protein